jgi:hypothetical protein
MRSGRWGAGVLDQANQVSTHLPGAKPSARETVLSREHAASFSSNRCLVPARHSTIQMTMRYSHVVPNVRQDAMDSFYQSDSEANPRSGADATELTGNAAK